MRKFRRLKAFAAQRDLLYHCHAPSDIYVYSRDMRYRYAFARWWSDEGPLILWVGLNPGTGDTEKRRRPTLERCIGWSHKWGAAGLMFANLFAARHKKPGALRDTLNPVGPHNDAALATLSKMADRTIVAWGNSGRLHGRAAEVVRLLSGPHCLGVTAAGQPRHPLYAPAATSAVPWPVAKGTPNNALHLTAAAHRPFRVQSSVRRRGR